MRNSLFSLVGVALLGAGAYVLYAGGSFTTREEVLKVGSLEVSAEERHPIRPWVAGAAVVAGAALIFVGIKNKA